jgi:diadenylate cyclase
MRSIPFTSSLNLPRLTVTSALDIIIVAVLIYQLLMILRGRRAFAILIGVLMLGCVYLVSAWVHLELLRTILASIAPYTGIALIVMFQSELRRMLARMGRSQIFGWGDHMQRREMTMDISLAVSQMSQRKVGALIVVERDIGLRTFIESGVAMDAFVSRDLLCAIFEPGGALHDGAAIIHNDRVAAAGCFLPLTMNPQLTKVGTRHRAAIGVTEEADCLAIVVSEESGRISVAAFGEIEFDVSQKRIEERLATHALRRDPKPFAREVYMSDAGLRDITQPGPLRKTGRK